MHASDCALHNAPAMPVGPCDCGVGDKDIIRECQAILAAYLPPDGADERTTISRLLELLDGPRGLAAVGIKPA